MAARIFRSVEKCSLYRNKNEPKLCQTPLRLRQDFSNQVDSHLKGDCQLHKNIRVIRLIRAIRDKSFTPFIQRKL
jgi:hypothetical protein